jgi:hypothetical protein
VTRQRNPEPKMPSSKSVRAKRKHFTVAEANAMLPLLRSILRDVTDLARSLQERQQSLSRVHAKAGGKGCDVYQEEVDQANAALERDQERMREFETELKNLGVELKDYFTGLIDFYSLRDGREIFLCWRLGEAEVAHWHELEAGFAGRQRLTSEPHRR